jgi:hypothetical protein
MPIPTGPALEGTEGATMEVVRIAGGGADPRADLPAGIAPEGQPPLVVVTWRDAWFDFDHADATEPRSDYLVTTVGFVIREGPRFVSIAQEVLPDGDGFRAVTHIPVAVIVSVTPVHLDGTDAAVTAEEGLYSADVDAAGASDLGRRDA